MASDKQQLPIRWPWQIPWVRGMLAACLVLAVIAGLIEAFHYIDRYATGIIRKQDHRPLKRIVLVDTPRWLSHRLLNQIAREAVNYTIDNPQHPQYAAELRDPLNGGILKIIADHYLHDQSTAQNAWIKRIIFIRRAWNPHSEMIEIAAAYRWPAALVVSPKGNYMISPHGLRLPGLYQANQTSALGWLIQIMGISTDPPAPGTRISDPRIKVALKLIHLLASQPYYRQIASINMSNLDGKTSALDPQITITTRFGTSIWWGRAPGKEGFYEVPAAEKLKNLARVYARYGRVDAGRSYIDIRGDQVLIPRPATMPATVKDKPESVQG